MLAATNAIGTARPSTQAMSTGAASLVGTTAGRGNPYMFVWNSTARDVSEETNKYDEATRSAPSCYMVGVKERIMVQTSDPNPWQWRRICFSAKGVSSLIQVGTTTTGGSNVFFEDAYGWRRVVAEPTTSSRTYLLSILFDGSYNIDWNDPFSAKIDNQRLKIHYDRTRTIQSGNATGVIRYFNCWHPMKKTLNYDDDENGEGMDSNYVATTGEHGMGDFYIVDFIRCIDAPTGNPGLLFQPEATLYWHER